VVHHPGACGVVALTPAGDVVLVRQFREAVRQELLEIPAGIRNHDGESAAACAARELLEETGYTATAVEPLASILTSPGFADERIDLFVAEASDGPRAEPTEPEVETVVMPLADALAAVRDGAIVDAKTVVGLLLAGRRSRA
jgi:ADP-ribose pyrophosphatase